MIVPEPDTKAIPWLLKFSELFVLALQPDCALTLPLYVRGLLITWLVICIGIVGICVHMCVCIPHTYLCRSMNHIT